jgi:excisionase family DNA binding protein
MSKRQSGKRRVKRRPGRGETVRAKRAASAMATVEEVAAALGIGRNQAYAAVQMGNVKAMRFGRRWLIPRAEIARLTGTATGATPAA